MVDAVVAVWTDMFARICFVSVSLVCAAVWPSFIAKHNNFIFQIYASARGGVCLYTRLLDYGEC